eukprot:scaffold113113_cov24-Tisochrysis_lutea.AAC.1
MMAKAPSSVVLAKPFLPRPMRATASNGLAGGGGTCWHRHLARGSALALHAHMAGRAGQLDPIHREEDVAVSRGVRVRVRVSRRP